MHFQKIEPERSLAGFIDNLWIYEGYQAEHINERILPSGTIEMVFNLHQDELRIYNADDPSQCDRHSGAVVSGPYKSGFLSDTAEEAFIMGVHFKPGGAFPFLGVPGDELTDRHVDLDLLWGRSARGLRDRLCESTTSDKRFDILQRSLVDHLTKPLQRHYAVTAGLAGFASGQTERIRDVARSVQLSERRFIQVFRSEVGLTPKNFSRIQRFQSVRAFIEHTEEPDWPVISVNFGYYDQSHLIREFREFAGTSPEAYWNAHAAFIRDELHLKTNHVPCR